MVDSAGLSYTVMVYRFPMVSSPEASYLAITNNDSQANYSLSEFSLSYNVFNPEMGIATIALTVRNLSQVSIVTDLAPGNLVKVIENVTTINKNSPVYVGYIASYTLSQNEYVGTVITLNLKSLLLQLGEQAVVNSSADLTEFGAGSFITDFMSNQIPLQNILSCYQKQSLISYAYQQGINNNNSPFVIRNGVENSLTMSTPVWFYAALNNNRLDALLKTLYPYQRVLYQDVSGTIRIEPLSTMAYQAVSGQTDVYHFDLTQQSLSGSTSLWQSFSINNNQADIVNRYYASLIYAGFALADDSQNNQPIVAISKPSNNFARVKQLLQSGYFENSSCETVDLSNGMIQDPTLLTYLGQGANQYLITELAPNSPTIGSMVQVYAARGLAQSLYMDTIIEIDTIRVSNCRENIPLAQCISINNPNLLDSNQFFCFGAELSYSEWMGSVLKLMCCKPYTYTAYWTGSLA